MANHDWMERCGGREVNFGKDKLGVFPELDNLELCQKIGKLLDEKNYKKAFMVYNLDLLLERFDLWREVFPMVEPFYAMKANDELAVLRTLAAVGCCYDCASQGEVDMILKLGVDPSRIIFAHPAKTEESILFAKKHDVKLLVVDSIEEILKQKGLFPNCTTVLRIAASSTQSIVDLSAKFGADPDDEAPEILKEAAKEGVNIHGISFHVGFYSKDPGAIPRALEATKKLIVMGRELGHEMRMVDIGGGFNGYDVDKFKECVAAARPVIEAMIKEFDLRFIAEPGTYMVASCPSSCVNIQLAKDVSAAKITGKAEDRDSRGIEYYITSTVYGAFVCSLFGYLNSPGRPLFPKNGRKFVSRIWGNTCDSSDKIETNKMMERLTCGDWIYYDYQGAYTTVMEAPFNGFPHPERLFAVSEKTWQRIQDALKNPR